MGRKGGIHMTMNSVTKTNPTTTATPATTPATIKGEVLEILAGLGVSEAEAKDLRNTVVDAALMALSDGFKVIGPDENWFNFWTIPCQHRSERWRAYMSRLYNWAWLYIRQHVIQEEYMADDGTMENPIFWLYNQNDPQFYTEDESGDYVLTLDEFRTAFSYSSAARWNVRIQTTIQHDGSEINSPYLTVDDIDNGESLSRYVGQVCGHELFIPDTPIGNLSASQDAAVAIGVTVDEAVKIMDDWQ